MPQPLSLHPEDDSILRVHSFTTPDITYDITVDWNNGRAGQLRTCTCPYFQTTGIVCKHIALAAVVIPDADICPSSYLETHADSTLVDLEELTDDPTNHADLPDPTDHAETPPTASNDFKVIQAMVNAIYQRFEVVDKEKLIEKRDEIYQCLKRSLELIDENMQFKEGCSRYNKRQKQPL
ncbi:hypothetical protein BGW41_000992 [Actinomortierella wolfii]|nr:hypothetical protein BGW41_000992 [Actinomortierella wolfii]